MSVKRLGFMQLTIICGFSLYYAWYLISFFGFFMFAPERIDFIALHTGQVVFFLGSIAVTLALLFWFRKADSVAVGHNRLLHLISLLLALPLPLLITVSEVTGVLVALWAFYIACFLCGCSIGFGFMLWEDLATHGYLNRGVLAHGTIFCAGGVIFLATTFLLDNAGASAISILLLCASTALLAFITPRCDLLEDKPVKPVQAYFRAAWHVDLVIIVISVIFGYAFMLLYHLSNSLLLGTMAVAVFVDLAFSVLFGRGKWIQFAGWARVCGAFVSCALILLVFPVGPLANVALFVIIVFWFMFRTMNGGSLTDLANHCDYSMLYSSLRGKLPANIGFTIGLAVGVAGISSNDTPVFEMYIPLAIVAVFILTALFFLPFDAESKTPGYKTLALVDMHEPRDANLSETCKAVTERYKLSPRESEVLTYLVRGRNAKHIAEKLFISESTTKTHISNIYRKLGIHSQQELLDLLERA